MTKKCFIIFLTILFCLHAKATTYYFSDLSGDDSRTFAQASNINSPWKSITKLNLIFSSLQPGDFALFKRGETFYGSVLVSRSGTASQKITISAYGSGDDPIFTTLVSVTNWTTFGMPANVYESVSAVSALTTARVCTDDGVLLHTARYPNTTYLTIDTHDNTGSTPTTFITDAGFNSSTFTDLDNGYIVVRDIQWALEKAPINTHSLSGTSGTKIIFGAGLNYEAKNGWGYFVQDFATALDAVGEFYYNPTTKKLRIYSTSTPTNVKISDKDNLVFGASRSYITFDNINFQGANANLISMTGTGITIQNCEVSFAGIEGIAVSGASFVTEACYVHDILDQGINTGSAGASIRNTQVINTGHIQGMNQNGAGKAAIANGGTGSITEYNTVRNTGYIGIRIGRTNALCKNNIIDNFCGTRNDGSAIYVQGVPNSTQIFSNCQITGNIIMNGSTASSAGVGAGNTNNSTYGIYGDDEMNGLVVTGNTVFNMPRAGYFFHGNKNITLTGNTGFDCAESQFFLSPSGAGWNASGFVVNNNIFVAKTTTQKVIYFNISPSESVAGVGTINNNYYSRPVLETVAGGWGAAGNIIQTSVSFGNYNYYNLDRWNSVFVHDAATTNFGVAITDPNKLSIIWNETKVPETKTLPNIYKDVTGASYSTSVVLQPFTSLVLLQTATGTGKITPTMTWATPADITYLTLLSATQLNATATVGASTIPGTHTYTPAINTLLAAGTYTLRDDFSPTDQLTYNSATKTVTLVVNPFPATLTYTDLLKTYNQLPQAPDVVTSPAGLQTINTLYGGVASTPKDAGSYPVTSGLSNQNYVASVISGTFVIEKAPAIITVTSNLNQFADGNPKPASAITTPAGLPLTYRYNGSATAPDAVGSYELIIDVVHANYTGSDTFTLTISASAANIFITDLLQTYDGTSKNVTVTSPYSYDLVYDPATHVAAGSYQVTATINDGIHTGSDVQTLVIQKKDPVLTWAPPVRIFEGTSLTMTELNVTSDIAGTFSFSSPVGTVLPAGTQIISATFTPTDANYNIVTISVSISVVGSTLNYYIINGRTIYVNQ